MKVPSEAVNMSLGLFMTKEKQSSNSVVSYVLILTWKKQQHTLYRFFRLILSRILQLIWFTWGYLYNSKTLVISKKIN